MPVIGSYSVGKLVQNFIGRLQVKQQGISSKGSAVLALGSNSRPNIRSSVY